MPLPALPFRPVPLLVLASLALAARLTAGPAVDPGLGPQLFLDDHLVERMAGLRREPRPPERLPHPVLDHATFGTTQNHLTVLREESGRFRAWYNRGDSVWHAESRDGVRWESPQPAWTLDYAFGASVVDDGPEAADPARRFKLANWQQLKRGQPAPETGMWVAFSPDGLNWTGYERNPVLQTWPEGVGVRVPHRTSDVIDVFRDEGNGHYTAFVKLPAVAADGYEPGPRAGALFRRLVGITTSRDFVHWTRPVRVFQPDDQDEGLLEFYSMSGTHVRGSLYIGFLRVLHDERSAEPGGPANGTGYTVLATSRDGINWTRQREPFLDRNPVSGTWDRAVAWGCAALQVGDETYIYYNGRALGHKVAPSDRQFGLAKMKRDRYVAIQADGEGVLVTRPFVFPAGVARVSLNADARTGRVRVRVLDAEGRAVAVGWPEDGKEFRGDQIAAELLSGDALRFLAGKIVKLEFKLEQAAVFGFTIEPVAAAPAGP